MAKRYALEIRSKLYPPDEPAVFEADTKEELIGLLVSVANLGYKQNGITLHPLLIVSMHFTDSLLDVRGVNG